MEFLNIDSNLHKSKSGIRHTRSQLIRTQKVRSWIAVVSRLLFCILRKTGNGILIPFKLETLKIFSNFMVILAVAARADTSSVMVRPADACPASSWCRATSGPRCPGWPPPWYRCSSWPLPAAASTASPSSTRAPPTSKCLGRARPGCGAPSFRLGKWRLLYF